MKKIIFGLLILAYNYMSGQETNKINNASVEKNIIGVHIGLLGIGINDEFKLARKFTVHNELGLITTPVISSQTTFLTTSPYYKIEPRYYYGLDRRARLNRNTRNNSSNYIGINAMYLNFVNAINHKQEKKDFNGLLIIPNYGIRRSLNQSFYYESCFGVAMTYTLLERDSNYKGKTSELLPYINIALGINF